MVQPMPGGRLDTFPSVTVLLRRTRQKNLPCSSARHYMIGTRLYASDLTSSSNEVTILYPVIRRLMVTSGAADCMWHVAPEDGPVPLSHHTNRCTATTLSVMQ